MRLSQMYRELPELVGLDRLIDLTNYSGTTDAAQMLVTASGYLQAKPHAVGGCRTAFVTADPDFGSWVASRGSLFEGCEQRVFDTQEEAEQFLDGPKAGAAAAIGYRHDG